MALTGVCVSSLLDSGFLNLPFFTLVTGPRRSLSLKLSDTKVYEPQIRMFSLCLSETDLAIKLI